MVKVVDVKNEIQERKDEVVKHLSNNDYNKFESTLKALSPLLDDHIYSFTEKIINIINDRYAKHNFSYVVKIYEILFDYKILQDFLSYDMTNLCDLKQRMNYSIIGIYSKYYFSLLKLNNPKFNFDLSRKVYNYHGIDIKPYFFYKHDTLINFGKYRSSNLTIRDLINIDPQYILWCIYSTKYFVLSYDLLTDQIFIKNNKYFIAVEINNLKHQLYSYHCQHYLCNKLPYKLPFLFLSGKEIKDEIEKLHYEADSIQELSNGDPEPSFGNDPQLEKIDKLIARYQFYLESYFPNISDYVSPNNNQ